MKRFSSFSSTWFSRLLYPDFRSKALPLTLTATQIRQFQVSRPAFARCWNCDRTIPENGGFPLQCPICQSPQKVSVKDVNFYEIFDHKVTYRIDLTKLSEKMKLLQKNLHPDLFSLKTKVERELSEELSSLVNKAYSTLQNPIDRAQYLLKLSGVDAATLESQKDFDFDFLTEIMELNEKVVQINNPVTLQYFRKQNDARILELSGEFAEAFDHADISGAVRTLNKMRYYDNVQKKLKTLQSSLGVVD